jgi:hypothetical protein
LPDDDLKEDSYDTQGSRAVYSLFF